MISDYKQLFCYLSKSFPLGNVSINLVTIISVCTCKTYNIHTHALYTSLYHVYAYIYKLCTLRGGVALSVIRFKYIYAHIWRIMHACIEPNEKNNLCDKVDLCRLLNMRDITTEYVCSHS